MNNFTRPVPLTEKPTSGFINNVSRASNAHHIIGGDGITVSHGPQGSIVEVSPVILPTYMVWAGDFNITGSYVPGQVVRVRPDVQYLDAAGGVIPFGTTDVSGFVNEDGDGTIPIAIGGFVCKKQIGPGWLDDSFIESEILPQFQNLPDGYVKGGRWYGYNVYYPIYPEIPKSFVTSVALHGNSITANEVFWEALPMGAYVHKACVSGNQVTTYDLLVVSGSSFQTEYLPYSGV